MSDAPPPATPPVPQFRWPVAYLLFAVVLPHSTIVAEWLGRFCASTYFEAIPGAGHALLLLAVPTFNLTLYLAHSGRVRTNGRVLAAASGFTFVVVFIYAAITWQIGALSVLVVPLTVVFPPGFLLCLMGITPLVCLFVWFVALGKVRAINTKGLALPWAVGALLSVVCFALVEAPTALTRRALIEAQSRDPEELAAAIKTLRRFGGADLLLEACYRPDGISKNQSPGMRLMDLGNVVGFIDPEPRGLTIEEARDLYFRVEGTPFNEQAPPTRRLDNGFRAAEDFDNWVWDQERAGEKVGARLKGLQLEQSRQDWKTEPAARLAFGEWTLVFKNEHREAHEARCQIKLPTGGVVSRLTLWVDGQPQEAAFDARAKVTAAYRNVVNVQRRDPVLVNQVGPDRVMMQCFPVPPQGGTIKVRLGITVPLRGDEEGVLTFPQIVERNFSFPARLDHSLWVNSPTPLQAADEATATAQQKDGHTWQKDQPHHALNALRLRVVLPTDAPVWTEDPLTTTPNRFLVRNPKRLPAAPLRHLVFVIDTSVSLVDQFEIIRDQLKALPRQVTWKALLPTDGTDTISVDASKLNTAFGRRSFIGGRDNSHAIVQAMREVATKGDEAAVIWLHGPQPVVLANSEKLLQQMERAPASLNVYAIELKTGPNRLLEALYQHHSLNTTAPIASGKELGAVLAELTSSDAAGTIYQYERFAAAPSTGIRVSDQLARYWAFEQAMSEKSGANANPNDIAKLAAQYQLVTPWSGAVVLERKEQYKRAGLQQVDASTVPTVSGIPEPSRTILCLFALLVLAMRRRRPQT